MRYHHPQPIDRQVALVIFATNDVIQISEALVCHQWESPGLYATNLGGGREACTPMMY